METWERFQNFRPSGSAGEGEGRRPEGAAGREAGPEGPAAPSRPRPGSFLLIGLLVVACSTATVRRESVERHEYPAGVAQMRWHTQIHEYPPTESRPEECASGALVGSHLVLGSRAGSVVAVDTGSGAVAWSVAVSGGVDGEARYDQQRGQVYVGTDDGWLYAIEPGTGAIRWSSKFKGPIDHAPAIGSSSLFLATAADRVFAVDPANGKPQWQYERDTPDGFTIHGYPVPRQEGRSVFAGFSDGYLVALRADNGELVWSRSLAAASDQFVDVDASPVVWRGKLIAASFSGGLYGLRPSDGEVLWHTFLDGISGLGQGASNLYAVSARAGLAAVSGDGNILWRHGLQSAGDLTVPVEAGPYLVFSGSREGLFVLEGATGKLLQIFDPARGMCAPPTVDKEGRALYVLANSGSLYAIDLIW